MTARRPIRIFTGFIRGRVTVRPSETMGWASKLAIISPTRTQGHQDALFQGQRCQRNTEGLRVMKKERAVDKKLFAHHHLFFIIIFKLF